MKTQKQHHFDKLQKSSFIFTQLGLVLALFVVYLTLEFKSIKEITVLHDVRPDEPISITSDIPDIIIERKNAPAEQQKIEKKFILDDIKIKPDDTTLKRKVLDLTIDDTPQLKIDDIVEVVHPPEDPPVPFIALEEAPIFPGCEGLNPKKSKECFTKQVSKFVNKRFDTGLAEELNLTGRQRIFVLFKIDKTGKVVDIIAKSAHKRLEKEAIRVVQKLPQMTPGKQRTKPVTVKYALPIVFQVN